MSKNDIGKEADRQKRLAECQEEIAKILAKHKIELHVDCQPKILLVPKEDIKV